MSLSGLKEFEYNLRKVMDSEAFKKADESKKLIIGYRLFNSKYGIGSGKSKIECSKLPLNKRT